MKHPFKIFVFLILLIWLLLIFIEWFVPIYQPLLIFIPFLQKTFSLVCHQQEYKLIVHDPFHTLVCSRCAGIYTGLLLMSSASIVFKFRENLDAKFLFYAFIPMLLDICCYSAGLYNYSRSIAFVTGVLLGSTGFLYFYSAINQYLKEKRV